MVRNRAENVAGWTVEELIVILLRQFKRLLAERGVTLTDAELQVLAATAAARQAVLDAGTPLVVALRELIGESLDVLMGWGLNYARSLATGMDAMAGWETTADFLSLANDKGNAELRISAGSALLVLLGARGRDLVEHVWATYQHGADDPEDVDAVIARRALSFAAQIDPVLSRADWEAALAGWMATLNGR
jgi:hypothetical protein